MEKINKRIIIIGMLAVAIAFSLILITLGYAFTQRDMQEEKWILQTYGNNVALYKGEEVVEVYGSIVLDTLPEEDKKMLDNGISFLSKEEAVTAIEDYDG